MPQVYYFVPEWKYENENILGFLSVVRIHRKAYYPLGGEARSITGARRPDGSAAGQPLHRSMEIDIEVIKDFF